MTAEEKLDIALSYLAEKNEGSYLYPKEIKLYEHLKEKGIADNEHLPILLHLQWGEYVSLFYADKEAKIRGENPTQIKITFKGIKFNEKGGYTKLLAKEKCQENVRKALNVIAVLTFLGVGWGLLQQYITDEREEERWRMDHQIPDTVKISSAPDTLMLRDTVYVPDSIRP